jgi:hypothetical protein
MLWGFCSMKRPRLLANYTGINQISGVVIMQEIYLRELLAQSVLLVV